MKPKVFNICKAQREIEDLQGKVIRLNIELEHYRDKNTPMQVEKGDYYKCAKCGHILCKNEDARELIVAEGLINFCPVCGQRVSWERKEWNTSNFTD